MAEKFVQVFLYHLTEKNPNKFFGQPNIFNGTLLKKKTACGKKEYFYELMG